jgi:hypothetical protein
MHYARRRTPADIKIKHFKKVRQRIDNKLSMFREPRSERNSPTAPPGYVGTETEETYYLTHERYENYISLVFSHDLEPWAAIC